MIRARLATRIAIIYAVVVGVFLFGTLYVFRQTVGNHFRNEILGRLQANDTAMVAMEAERVLADGTLAAPELHRWVEATAAERGKELALLDPEQKVVFSTTADHQIWRTRPTEPVACGGRHCQVSREVPYPSFAPLMQEGSQVGLLAMTHDQPLARGQRLFSAALAILSVLGFAVVLLLSLYLTRPIRRLSRSMDHIAGGDLSHRVPTSGSDEVSQMGRSFNAMADRLESLLVRQKELLAGVSHELRSPLSRMKLSLEMLRDSGADEKRTRALDREIDNLDRLVHELLWVSRLELEEQQLATEAVAVAELARDGWQRVEAAADMRGIELELDLSPEDVQVDVDPTLVVRVLGNLFENAVRHGGKGPITVTARPQGGRVELCIADRGPGVPDEALPRLFDALFRVDRSRSRRTGGTGLGLMIVKRAIEVHRGQVVASTPPEGGLAITFDLPAPS